MNANEWGAGGGMRGNAYDLVDDDDEDDDELYGRREALVWAAGIVTNSIFNVSFF